jgi:hypothetical protein
MNKTIDCLMSQAFDNDREPRSNEYKKGVRSTLEFCIIGGNPVCPYPMGTASADAFISGMDEGRQIYQIYKSQQVSPRGAV